MILNCLLTFTTLLALCHASILTLNDGDAYFDHVDPNITHFDINGIDHLSNTSLYLYDDKDKDFWFEKLDDCWIDSANSAPNQGQIDYLCKGVNVQQTFNLVQVDEHLAYLESSFSAPNLPAGFSMSVVVSPETHKFASVTESWMIATWDVPQGGGLVLEYPPESETISTSSVTIKVQFASDVTQGTYRLWTSTDPSVTSKDALSQQVSKAIQLSDAIQSLNDQCPQDDNKWAPGACGCGVPDTDTDLDGTPDCIDECPNDSEKIEEGVCGCGVADTDTDLDGTPDCIDECPNDSEKIEKGVCGCGVADTDTDLDGTPDCIDECPNDSEKIEKGVCGCGVADTDTDLDGTPDCIDECPNDSEKIEKGVCGCGVADTDTDLDGTPDCIDECPNDSEKIEKGVCGCGVADTDTDLDGIPDCVDECPKYPTAEEANVNTDGDDYCDIGDPDPDCPLDFLSGYVSCDKIFKPTQDAKGKYKPIVYEISTDLYRGRAHYQIKGPLREKLFAAGGVCEDYILTGFQLSPANDAAEDPKYVQSQIISDSRALYQFWSTAHDFHIYVDVNGSNTCTPRLLAAHHGNYTGPFGEIHWDECAKDGEKGPVPKYRRF
eukprot:Clim_evm1s243 gene=Clim_evmTU1s243